MTDGGGGGGGGGGDDDDRPEKADKSSARAPWRAMGLASRARFVLDRCTVEPVFGCYVLTSVLTGLCTQNLSLQKACRVNLRLGDGTCAALERRDSTAAGYMDAEVAVQRLVAGMAVWKTAVVCSVPAALIVFVGSWSDRHRRRKPCMLAPIAGELVSSVGMLLCTRYFYELPMEVVGLVEAVPPALAGGWMLMAMAVFSYIGDVSTVSERDRQRVGWQSGSKVAVRETFAETISAVRFRCDRRGRIFEKYTVNNTLFVAYLTKV